MSTIKLSFFNFLTNLTRLKPIVHPKIENIMQTKVYSHSIAFNIKY